MNMRTLLPLLVASILVMTACSPVPADLPAAVPPVLSSQPPDASATASEPSPAQPTATTPPTPSATQPPTPTATATNTPSPTPTIIPTYAILRGSVNVERASCRFGPGWMYLYLYGLLQTANQEIIGRTDTGEWLLTRAPGDTTVCWIKADLLDIQGDVMAVEMVYPDKFTLIVSPYYYPPVNVAATRNGNQVTITWDAESLRAGDEESPTSPLFVVETWVCRAGKLVFTPLAAWSENAVVADEPGCAEPSHGRVFLSEKHGYAGPSEIPWPPAAP